MLLKSVIHVIATSLYVFLTISVTATIIAVIGKGFN